MREIIGFIRLYIRETNKSILALCTLFLAVLIWLNYREGLEYYLVTKMNLPFPAFTGRWLIFIFSFLVPHILLYANRDRRGKPHRGFVICALLAPIIFAIKMGIETNWQLSGDPHWNSFWNDILYWPVRLAIMLIMLAVLWRIYHRPHSFYGMTTKKFSYRPYTWMLLIMVPLIAAASTLPDFQLTYPKLMEVIPLPENAEPGIIYKILFELSYGSDFLSIELFFRGFLIIGLMKWVGKDAILPMACFYCTIHFGKPLGECISSYFGGFLLGIVCYHSKSIYGGLIVHLGIAWLMELGGYIGNLYKW